MDERIYKNIIEANTKLLDENKLLKEDKEILQKRINKAKEYNKKNIHSQTLSNILKGEYVYEQ